MTALLLGLHCTVVARLGIKTWQAEALCSLHNWRQALFAFPTVQAVPSYFHIQTCAIQAWKGPYAAYQSRP